MTVYKNNNPDEKSIFASVDLDDTNNTAFFFVRNEVDVEKAKNSLASAGQTIIAQSYVKGHTVLITQGTISKEELFDKISTARGDKFELVPPEEKTTLKFIKENGWKIRGGSSVIGQSATLFTAANSVSVADAVSGGKPKFDPAKGFFAIFNLAANCVNYFFGGQKEADTKGLDKFDEIIADEVNRYLPSNQKQLSPDDVRKLSYMSDKERADHEKDKGFWGAVKRNSVQLGEVGLRTLGSFALMFGPLVAVLIRPWNWKSGFGTIFQGSVKEIFAKSRSKDNFTFVAGIGMMSGKIMGLLAQTQDPNNPPTTYWEEIRQKVLWPVSSFVEMISQGAMTYDEHKNKLLAIGGKYYYNITGVLGNAILTVPPYPTRLVLPYGKKVLDIDEVQARLLDEVHKLPKDKIPEVLARVTARMVEHIGDDSPSFTELYRKLIDKLEKYHSISVLPYKDGELQKPAPSWAGDLAAELANSPLIADDVKTEVAKKYTDIHQKKANKTPSKKHDTMMDFATTETALTR